MHDAYLGLGSNIGDRHRYIVMAIDALEQHPHITVLAASSAYETLAVSSIKQPHFINQVVMIQTTLSPLDLLDTTESIEKTLGRTNKGLGDPRTIDIDILFYDDDIVSNDRLTIPHPLAHERTFVLNPMHDLAPNHIHPILNDTIATMKAALSGY